LDNISIIENGVLSELIDDELKDGTFTGTGILESKFSKQCQKIVNSILGNVKSWIELRFHLF
jgi:hypothetical protein